MQRVVVLAVVSLLAWTGWAQAGAGLGIADLERILADWRLGCGGCGARFGWEGADLARYVAGRLVSGGFRCELGRSGGDWWVLVKLAGPGGEVVVPVLPGLPPAGRDGEYTQGVFLGRVPWVGPGTPDPRYLAPDEVLPLPPNVLPTARLRIHPAEPQPGGAVWFDADIADPDGVIVQAWWEFGDGESSAWWSPEHSYAQEGTYTVILTVVDDRGGVAVAKGVVQVKVSPPPPPGGGGGCGCGR